MGILLLAEMVAHFLDEGAEERFFIEAAVVDAEGDGRGVVDRDGAEMWGLWCKQRRQHGDAVTRSNEGGGCFDRVAEEDVGEWSFAHKIALKGNDWQGGMGRREDNQRCLAQVIEAEGGCAGEWVIGGT